MGLCYIRKEKKNLETITEEIIRKCLKLIELM